MDQVNLYTYTTIRGPGTKSGSYTFILEYITAEGPATLTKPGTLEGVTENQAHLRILQEALGRLKKGCEVTVYTDSRYIQQGAKEWLKGWQNAGWINKRGKPVANKEDWEKLAQLLARHLVAFEVGTWHPYSGWIQTETEKAEKERRLKCSTDSENLTARQRSTRQP